MSTLFASFKTTYLYQVTGSLSNTLKRTINVITKVSIESASISWYFTMKQFCKALITFDQCKNIWISESTFILCQSTVKSILKIIYSLLKSGLTYTEGIQLRIHLPYRRKIPKAIFLGLSWKILGLIPRSFQMMQLILRLITMRTRFGTSFIQLFFNSWLCNVSPGALTTFT